MILILLLLELLIRYGGTWIDSTVLCTSSIEKIPEYYFDSDLFFYQTLKPGKDGCQANKDLHKFKNWIVAK